MRQRRTGKSLPAFLGAAIFLGAAALGSGCSGIKDPKFTVRSVTITEQTESGVVLTFVLEGENRNDKPLPLREVEYALWLDGREVFRGKRSAEVTLSRFSTRPVVLPVAAAIGTGETALTGEVPYRFSGTVIYETPGAIAETLFDNNVRRPSASFAESGRLNFSAPATEMMGPTLD